MTMHNMSNSTYLRLSAFQDSAELLPRTPVVGEQLEAADEAVNSLHTLI